MSMTTHFFSWIWWETIKNSYISYLMIFGKSICRHLDFQIWWSLTRVFVDVLIFRFDDGNCQVKAGRAGGLQRGLWHVWQKGRWEHINKGGTSVLENLGIGFCRKSASSHLISFFTGAACSYEESRSKSNGGWGEIFSGRNPSYAMLKG